MCNFVIRHEAEVSHLAGAVFVYVLVHHAHLHPVQLKGTRVLVAWSFEVCLVLGTDDAVEIIATLKLLPHTGGMTNQIVSKEGVEHYLGFVHGCDSTFVLEHPLDGSQADKDVRRQLFGFVWILERWTRRKASLVQM